MKPTHVRLRIRKRLKPDSTENRLKIILLKIEKLKNKLDNLQANQEITADINDEISTKTQQAQELLEQIKNSTSKTSIVKRNWSFLDQQNKLNLLSNKVTIQPGDALCSVNIVIEGSIAYQWENDNGSKAEMYFVSLLHLLETSVLHERIWMSETHANRALKVSKFPYGYFAQMLQSEGILQAYTGIISLADNESIDKRISLYKRVVPE